MFRREEYILGNDELSMEMLAQSGVNNVKPTTGILLLIYKYDDVNGTKNKGYMHTLQIEDGHVLYTQGN